MGRTHAAMATVAALGVAAAADVTPAAVPVLAALGWLSGYGPDVDHKSSRAGKLLPPVCWAVRALSVRTVGIAHRGLTHTLFAAVCWALFVGALSAVWLHPIAAVWTGVFAGVGWLTGVLGDIPTRQSLQHVLWPSARQVWWPVGLRFTTGRGAELVIFNVLVVVGVLLLPAAMS